MRWLGILYSWSVVIFKEDFRRAGFSPSECNAPLHIDAYRVAPSALERVESVGGWLVQIIETLGCVKIIESLERLTLQVGRDSANGLSLPDLLRRDVREALQHSNTVSVGLCLSTRNMYDKQTYRSPSDSNGEKAIQTRSKIRSPMNSSNLIGFTSFQKLPGTSDRDFVCQ